MPPDLRALVPVLFERLVDDAGLFPPAELSMKTALERHRQDVAGAAAVLSGRFVCPAARLGELIAALVPSDLIKLALLSPLEDSPLAEALELLAGEPRLQLAAVEGPIGDLGALRHVPRDVPCFVEISLTDEWKTAHSVVREAGHSAKVRCGGARAELFPSSRQLAGFIHASANSTVSFKATAGLHHALGYLDDSTGFAHHGFLNLLVAAGRAVDGAPHDQLVSALECRAVEDLVSEAQGLKGEHAAATRALFVSYGSCSTSEPVEDLFELGLLAVDGASR
ncbi:MAG: hypothetical protein ACYCSF_14405 [Acidimicrobiales bacterium]